VQTDRRGYRRILLCMKATDFEYRHQKLVHQFIVAAAFLTYLIDREDVVWRFVKGSTAPRELERSVFTFATLLIVVGAGICTWALGHHRPESTTGVEPYREPPYPGFFGEFLYSMGLGSLAPLSGFVILVGGEALRLFRLFRRVDDEHGQHFQAHPSTTSIPLASAAATETNSSWGKAFQQEAAKWGIFLTMMIFVITLKDRLAEILAASSFLVGVLLNARRPLTRHHRSEIG
jgi:hypothetical protein